MEQPRQEQLLLQAAEEAVGDFQARWEAFGVK